jgi:glycosyltransferase involved in cell wall biosynthesis
MGIPVHVLPHRAGLGYFLNARGLRKLLHEIKPDLLHSNYASGYGTLGRLTAFHPHLVSVWGDDVYQYPYQSWFNSWNIRKTLSTADWVSSTSRAMALQASKLVDLEGKVSVIPFGVDTQRFRPGPYEQRDFEVAVFKHLDRNYGVDIVIEAWSIFQKLIEGRLTKLVLAGTGPDEAFAKDRVRELGLDKSVEFTGVLSNEEVASRLRKTDAVLNLSRWESFGVAILEALASGVPVIATDVGGVSEVLPIEAGELIPLKGAAYKVAQILLDWFSNPEKCRRMGQRGSEFVAQTFSQTHCTELLFDLYGKITS